MKPFVLNIIKFTIGLLLIIILINFMDTDVLKDIIKKAAFHWIILAFIVFLLSNIILISRFYILLEKKINFYTVFKLIMASYIFANILPTSIGGDAYKALYLKKTLTNWTNSLYIIFIERLIGVISLVFIGALCMILNFTEINYFFEKTINIDNTLFTFTIIFVAVSVTVIYSLRMKITKILSTIQKVDKRIIISVFFHSILMHILRFIYIYLILLSFNISLGFDKIAIIITIVAIFSLLSITIGAIGVKEGIMAYGFKFFGIAPEFGFITSIIERLFGIILLPLSVYYFIELRKENYKLDKTY